MSGTPRNDLDRQVITLNLDPHIKPFETLNETDEELGRYPLQLGEYDIPELICAST